MELIEIALALVHGVEEEHERREQSKENERSKQEEKRGRSDRE